MCTIKVKFRPSALAGHEGNIYYQVIHQRTPRQLLSGCRVYPAEWDSALSTVASPATSDRMPLIASIREKIMGDVERLGRIARHLDDAGLPYSADDVIAEFHRYASEFSLFRFMQRAIDRLKTNGKTRTSETYTAALRSFRQFRADQDIMLDCINSDLMEAYEAWHVSRGNAPNTISFYIRIIRAVYNRALENEIMVNRHPFRRVYTGVEKTVKRALPLPAIRRIRLLDLSAQPPLDWARDLFILSFMLRGMSFVDMAYLRKADLANGYVAYRRRKTGQLLTIKWTPQMQQILDKYPANPTAYLLPIIRRPGINERCAYRNAAYNVNRALKTIASMAGIAVPVTLYVARHSWASAAKSKGIPISVISEGMGHDSESTTQIYLASLDTSVVDRANSLILNCL
ncbi:MAG: site-specific integrase [Muribaculaceae bacterium]|nr:site-specific integrase [Muribaculaceae bacterium]